MHVIIYILNHHDKQQRRALLFGNGVTSKLAWNVRNYTTNSHCCCTKAHYLVISFCFYFHLQFVASFMADSLRQYPSHSSLYLFNSNYSNILAFFIVCDICVVCELCIVCDICILCFHTFIAIIAIVAMVIIINIAILFELVWRC